MAEAPRFSPNSTAARDVAYHLHPYTNLRKHMTDGPLVITRGKGVHVYDDEDNEYIEGLAGLWCAALGFGEERLVQAAERQMRKLPYYHSFFGKTPEVVVDLAEKLIRMAPVPMSKVLFSNSGSEANDTVVKLIWYYNNAADRPNKKKIISRLKGYHGVTLVAASLTGLPYLHDEFDLPLDRFLYTSCPHHYRYAEAHESEEDFATRMADDLDRLILAEGPDTVAAFFAEPVMGAGGVLIPPRTYFEKIQAVLKEHDVLFVADEVICGFGRTGNMFGTQTFDLKPDFITVAKALSSAYVPISAVLISEPVFQAMQAQSDKLGLFGHGYTYTGHPVAAAVALETLNIYEERDIVACVRRVSPRFRDGLNGFADHPLVGEVRTIGLLGGVELVRDKATKESFPVAESVGIYLVGRAQAHGLLVRPMGDTIGFCPPLIITEAEIDELLARFGRALDDTAAMVEQKGLAKVA